MSLERFGVPASPFIQGGILGVLLAIFVVVFTKAALWLFYKWFPQTYDTHIPVKEVAKDGELKGFVRLTSEDLKRMEQEQQEENDEYDRELEQREINYREAQAQAKTLSGTVEHSPLVNFHIADQINELNEYRQQKRRTMTTGCPASCTRHKH